MKQIKNKKKVTRTKANSIEKFLDHKLTHHTEVDEYDSDDDVCCYDDDEEMGWGEGQLPPPLGGGLNREDQG